VRLRVLASEYDGRNWVRLSDDAELQELPGAHFDLVTIRIDELARRMRSWLSDGASRANEPARLAPRSGDKAFPTKGLPPATNDKVAAPPLADGASNGSFSRLRKFFDYARRSATQLNASSRRD
jgi:hypothetical protein